MSETGQTLNANDFIGEDASPEQSMQPGDMALVIGVDGTIKTISLSPNMKLIKADPETLSDADLAELEAIMTQGEKFFALTLAAKSDFLMSVLMTAANDPAVINQERLLEIANQITRPN